MPRFENKLSADCLIFRVGSLEIRNFVIVLEVPDARGHFVDEVVIVCDDQDSALIALERNVKRVDGFEIKMVRRFIEDEDVRFLKHQLAEQ